MAADCDGGKGGGGGVSGGLKFSGVLQEYWGNFKF